METVKLSPFDRLLNIHQSLELNQTKKINKRILQEQVYQNAELQYLNKQINTANQYNRQILENQIREIERRESQKFYKNLSFKNNSLVSVIDHIADPLVKKYFVDRYLERIKEDALTADSNLEEINDKVFNKNTLSNINRIKTICDGFDRAFSNSPFYVLDGLIEQVKIKNEAIAKFKQPQFFELKIIDKPKVNILRFIALLILGLVNVMLLMAVVGAFVSAGLSDASTVLLFSLIFLIPFIVLLIKDLKWRRSYNAYLLSQNKLRENEDIRKSNFENSYLVKLDQLNIDLKQHPAFQTYEAIKIEYPEFEIVIEELSMLERSNTRNVPL